MAFFSFKTSAPEASLYKSLLYAHAGWGKTTQCAGYQDTYGKGFIISGEAGLSSISDRDIDYLPFTSWDGEHDPENGVCSFLGITREIDSPEFKEQGFKWIALDSLTELSDRLVEHCEKMHEGNKNAFAMWGDYNRLMLGALKWIRDLPYHVLVTALAGEETDDNGAVNYWPLVKGNKVSKQIPGIFDNVLCGVRVTEGDATDPTIRRFIITEEVRGWHGKVRDPYRVLKAIEEEASVIALFQRIEQAKKELNK